MNTAAFWRKWAKRGTTIRFWEWLVPTLLVVLTIGVRLYHVDAPLFDYHAFRQTDTATIALNFYRNGYQILHPQLNEGGPQPVDVASEFPIYSFVVALLYGIFGTHDLLGRIVSVAFAGGTVLVLYYLVRRMDGREAGFYAALFFALSPYGIFFTRTFMPESAMLFFSATALLTFHRWLERKRPVYLVLASACAALMILAKLPAILVGVPLLYLAIRRFRARVLLVSWLWVYAGVALVPALLWYAYAWQVGQHSGVSFAVFSSASPEGWSLLRDPAFYSLVAGWLLDHVLTISGFVLFALGLIGLLKSSWKGFYVSYLAAVGVYLAAGAKGLVVNDYYILPAVLALAPLVGLGAVFLRRHLCLGANILSRSLGPLAITLAFVLLAWQSAGTIGPLYALSSQTIAAGAAVDKLIDPNATVVVAGAGVPELLYAANRHGWTLFRDRFSAKAVADLRDRGAEYLLTIDREWMLASGDFLSVVRQYPVAAATQNYLLLKLAPGPLSTDGDPSRFQPLGAIFGGKLTLEDWATLGDPSRDGVIRLSLRWRAGPLEGDDLRYSVRLVDHDGLIWGQQDSSPLGGFFPTTSWHQGDVVTDYLEVPLLAGTPPGQYRLEITVYDGRTTKPVEGRLPADGTSYLSISLGPQMRGPFLTGQDTSHPSPPAGPLTMGKVSLVSAEGAPRTLSVGEPLGVDLVWQALARQEEEYTATLELRRGSQIVAASETRPLGANHPASEWQPGELVRDRFSLPIDPRAEGGKYDLILRVRPANGEAKTVNLGKVTLEVPQRSYQAPDPQVKLSTRFGQFAELTGYDVHGSGDVLTSTPNSATNPLSIPLTAGTSMTFTLHWRAASQTGVSYTVFVQVLDNQNRVVSQHDGLPTVAGDAAQGPRPTSGWLTGEILLDQHGLDLPVGLPDGRYTVIAGLYNAKTGQRVLTQEGNDFVVLGAGVVGTP